jgi:hypothetical protein
MRAGVTVFGGIVAGAGLAIAVVNLLAAGSQIARLVWNVAPSKLGLLAGFTLLGAGGGLMLAAVTSKKSDRVDRRFAEVDRKLDDILDRLPAE